jgi:hypothetical protein
LLAWVNWRSYVILRLAIFTGESSPPPLEHFSGVFAKILHNCQGKKPEDQVSIPTTASHISIPCNSPPQLPLCQTTQQWFLHLRRHNGPNQWH